MFWLGAVDPARYREAREQGLTLPSLHSSEFAPLPEPAIRIGVTATERPAHRLTWLRSRSMMRPVQVGNRIQLCPYESTSARWARLSWWR
jgi:hypothetical protein